MSLYLIRIDGVYPPQCVTVTDDRNRAEALRDAIAAHFDHIAHLVSVRETDEFYPSGYVDADTNVARFAFRWSLVN